MLSPHCETILVCIFLYELIHINPWHDQAFAEYQPSLAKFSLYQSLTSIAWQQILINKIFYFILES